MADIYELSSNIVDQLIERDPALATFLGAPGRDHLWPDTSPRRYEADRAFWADVLEQARACEVDGRSAEVAKAVLVAEAEKEIGAIDARRFVSDLNNLASPWQSIREIFDAMRDDAAEAWDNIIERLRTIDRPLDGYRQCLALGLDEGRVAARRQVVTAIDQGRAAAGSDSSFGLLLGRFDTAAEDEPALDDARRSALSDAIAHARAAFGAMTDWLEAEYLPAAPEADGVGRERYIASAQQFLGEEIDVDALYAWGWAEFDRLSNRMAELCRSIDPERPTAEVVDRLKHDPATTVHGVDGFLDAMLDRQIRALRELEGSHFDVPEQIRTIDVKAAPPGGALAPYYAPPSEDFSRAGCVWYPIGGRTEFPLFEEVTTAYHEGFPGHHLQVGWQAAMGEELSRFHRLLVWYPGSGEGWALYAEHLMGELGYLEEPAYEAGLISSQLLRTVRIVIDIGWHCGFAIPEDQSFHPGEAWSYELAVELLTDGAYIDREFAESEAVRYAGWPGQAISYKVGERAILDLREEMSQADDFDLKQFHADLLSVGSIGLDLMRDLVRSA